MVNRRSTKTVEFDSCGQQWYANSSWASTQKTKLSADYLTLQCRFRR